MEDCRLEMKKMGDGLRSFEDLEVWRLARKVVNAVYALTRDSRLGKDFGLCSQIQRAAVSIMSNIAEGFERHNVQEKIQFYNISRGSCGEVRSLLYVVVDNYVGLSENATSLRELVMQTGRLITGLIQSTQNRKKK